MPTKISKLAVILALSAASASSVAWWNGSSLGPGDQRRPIECGFWHDHGARRTAVRERLRNIAHRSALGSFGAGHPGFEYPGDPFGFGAAPRPEMMQQLIAQQQALMQWQAQAWQQAYAARQEQWRQQAQAAQQAYAEHQAQMKNQAEAWQRTLADQQAVARDQIQALADRQRQWVEELTQQSPASTPEPAYTDPFAGGRGYPFGERIPDEISQRSQQFEARYQELRKRREAEHQARIEGYNKRRAAVLERGNRRDI